MTDPAEAALGLLEGLIGGPDSTARSVDRSAPQASAITSAQMLRALMASNFNLNQAIVRLSSDD